MESAGVTVWLSPRVSVVAAGPIANSASVWGRELTSSANQELFRGSELKNELKNVIFMPKSRPEWPPEPHFLAAEV